MEKKEESSKPTMKSDNRVMHAADAAMAAVEQALGDAKDIDYWDYQKVASAALAAAQAALSVK